MNILILTTWLAPYRIDLYNELAKHATVTVLYEMTTTSERNKEWSANMSSRCKYIKITRGLKFPIIGRSAKEFINMISGDSHSYDIIYIDGYSSLSLIQAINYLSKHGIHYFVNVDGAIFRPKEKLPVSIFKKWILNRKCSYLCGAKVANNYLKHYGVKDDQIFNHPFTSLFQKDILDAPIDNAIKSALRKELDLTENHIILSVGRFSYKNGYGKGYDAIIRAAARMSKEYGFYIVGDNPTEEFIEMRNKYGASNVHFLGFKQKEELKKYYQAADIFVLMTVYDVWGLVVNEAMSNGLPVITTDMCVAGLDLIKDGENGYIIPVGDDSALQNMIINGCSDPLRLSKMQKNALSTIRPYTIENLAKSHLDVFNQFTSGNE